MRTASFAPDPGAGRPAGGASAARALGAGFDGPLAALSAAHALIVRRILEAICCAIPDYRQHPDLAAGVERISDLALSLFVQFARGQALDAECLAGIRQLVATRADDGILLTTLQRALRLAKAVVLQALVELDGEELEPLLGEFVELLAEEIRAAYQARASKNHGSRSELVARLYRAILIGSFPRDGAGEAPTGPLVDLSAPHSLLLVRTRRATADAAAVAAAFAALPQTTPVVMSDTATPHLALVVGTREDDPRWHAHAFGLASRTDAVLLATGRCATPDELHARYQRAVGLLPALVRLAGHGVVDLAALADYEAVLAAPAEQRAARVQEVLGPLLAQGPEVRKRLLPTLAAFVEVSPAIASVAAVCGKDRKTVSNHMREIRALTGRSIDRPREFFALAWSYRAMVLDGTPDGMPEISPGPANVRRVIAGRSGLP